MRFKLTDNTFKSIRYFAIAIILLMVAVRTTLFKNGNDKANIQNFAQCSDRIV